MPRRLHNFDESDVKIRPGKRSRPRTKNRPAHDDALPGMVVSKDRGRYGVVLDDADSRDDKIVCMRARELGRKAIVVGERVGVVGDTSGREGSLARIVKIFDRTSSLRRTADDNDPFERVVIANASVLLIVCAIADPVPRTGFVERALVAAFAGGIQPVLVLTKTDLGDPEEFAKHFRPLDVPIVTAGIHDDLEPITELITGETAALIGHSGVGKSTLMNRLVPGAGRATGDVSGVGKGRHTSTQSVALPFEPSGWLIDTPGIRSFGLAHIDADMVVDVFSDLAEACEKCPRGCTHLGPPADPECGLDTLEGVSAQRAEAIRNILEVLRSTEEWEL